MSTAETHSIPEAARALPRPLRLALLESYGDRIAATDGPLSRWYLAVGTALLEEHRRLAEEEAVVIIRSEADFEGMTFLDEHGNEVDPAG